MSYDHKAIEEKWQRHWAEAGTYRTQEDPKKEKSYVLDMFPYPSGEGLHVGHPKGYIATDIYARTKRMQGRAVLHPMGWDAFGLPAENFALKNKVHPRAAVEKNIANFKAQLAHIGFDYDWSREIHTTDPSYYKWTQWIFLKLLEHGLAYQSDEPINWCPSCMTGLANEDLDQGRCERCDTAVVKKKLPQWVLKITSYADRMLADLDTLDWPEHIKEAQRNWIGRSEGAEIDFALAGRAEKVAVFTTRPDTLYGATYLVLAPEHPLIERFAGESVNAGEVRRYVQAAAAKTDIERGAEGREKTGVQLKGIMAVNPGTKEEIPIFAADYVSGSYGTGAIMAVPAHDERDYEFAKKFDLPIKQVVMPSCLDERNPPREGKREVERENIIAIVHDPGRDRYLCLKWKHEPWITFVTGGMDDEEDSISSARREVEEETGYGDLEFVADLGRTRSTFFASHKDENRVANNAVLLFRLASDTQGPVADEEAAKHGAVWLTPQEIEEAGMQHAEFHIIWPAIRAQAFLPYTRAGPLINSSPFSGRESEEAKKAIVESVGGRMVVRYKIRNWVFSRQRYWGEPIPVIHCEKCGTVPVPYDDLPVTLPEVERYEPSGTGESPLANITEWVNVPCPTCGGPGKRETNTMPQWAGSSWYYLRFMDPHDDAALVSEERERYWAPVDVYVGGDHAVRHLIYARFWHKFLFDIGAVSTPEPFKRLEFLGFILAEDGRKMSKRLGNVINPDDVVAQYGADAFRIYEMFMGPFENTTAWSTASIAGTGRFIERVWRAARLAQDARVSALDAVLNHTIKKVGEDVEAFKFNTAIAQLMICMNEFEKVGAIGKGQWSAFLRVLAPFAPHIAEELWSALGEPFSIHTAPWPAYDPALLASAEVTVVVQVAGKKRGEITLAPDASEQEALAAALALTPVSTALGGSKPSRTVYVPGRILNVVP